MCTLYYFIGYSLYHCRRWWWQQQRAKWTTTRLSPKITGFRHTHIIILYTYSTVYVYFDAYNEVYCSMYAMYINVCKGE